MYSSSDKSGQKLDMTNKAATRASWLRGAGVLSVPAGMLKRTQLPSAGEPKDKGLDKCKILPA